ncbi:MAG: PD-(D/E)XK nuclease superfamily protein [Firmicutes bacterium ADurb.Bin419]|nr:MAG: PD-(D/E)XK nuclease superfamily protein [Firmicutes bacterium ADurb.Bin419]
MSDHAILSASSSHRWLNCLPSARLELEFEGKENEAASEGTAAHALCEHKLRKALKMRSKKPVSKFDSDEMDQYTDEYVEYVLEALSQAKLKCSDPTILIEQHLDFSCYVPDGFGTGDCIIISDGLLHIIDFKYGMGVLVNAESNPQMMLYAIGAIEIFDSLYDISEVSMTIYQPRRENISTWTISVNELNTWAEKELKPKAVLAYNGEGSYCPGEWCTFCRASVKCRARAEAKMNLAKFEFKLPPLLTDEEVEEILASINDLTKWANEIIAYATDSAINHGKQWSDFKIVEGRSNRKYKDEEAVANAVKSAGYSDIYKRSLITITEMEALLGKSKFQEVLGDLVYKPPGKLTLVPTSDKRSAMNVSNAKNEFYKIEED